MSDPIDTKIVSRLAAILKMNDLAELEYETETCRISLIKSHAPLPPAPAPFTPAPAQIRFNSDAKLETVKDIVDYVEANAK